MENHRINIIHANLSKCALTTMLLCVSISNIVVADLVVTDLHHGVDAYILTGYINIPLLQPPLIYSSYGSDGDISGPVNVYLQKDSHAFAYAEADHLSLKAWN